MRRIMLWLQRFADWRIRHISNSQFVLILAFITGLVSGLAAVLLKNLVHFTHHAVTGLFDESGENLLFLGLPLAGLLLTILFIKRFIKEDIRHGVSKVLHAISKRNGMMHSHNNYSSMVGSTLTIGFGGSLGLEAPIVTTGASLGSYLGRLFRMDFKTLNLLIGCGAAGAIAGIFKAPIAGLVFTLEVLMLDMTMLSIIPLLISAVTGAIIATIFLGEGVIFHFSVDDPFIIGQIPFYLGLGVFCGLISLYFTRTAMHIEERFGRVQSTWKKWLAGGIILGVLIFLFPPLYGEGYAALKSILSGHGEELVYNSPFYSLQDQFWTINFILIAILIFKVVAMASTTGAGGVGGVFAPTLFMGGLSGYLFARLVNASPYVAIPEKNFALVGMAGMMAGVMHAPLTAIFLIAELSGGYELFLPLIMTATISFLTINYFEPHSIYTKRLAEKGELRTHDKDKTVLGMMRISSLIESNFKTIHLEASLGELVKVIAQSERNVFPVINKEGLFEGVVFINDIREIMFNHEMYDTTFIRDLMYMPDVIVSPEDSMEDVAALFSRTPHYNIPVLKDGKYVGFVSRARVFSSYRSILRDISYE